MPVLDVIRANGNVKLEQFLSYRMGNGKLQMVLHRPFVSSLVNLYGNVVRPEDE